MQRLNLTASVPRCCIRFNSTSTQPASESRQPTSAKLSRRVLTDLGGIAIPTRKELLQLKSLAPARDLSRNYQPNLDYLKNAPKTMLSKRLEGLKSTKSADLQLREDPHVIARRASRMERQALKAARYQPAQPEVPELGTTGAMGNLDQRQVNVNVIKTEVPITHIHAFQNSSSSQGSGENDLKMSTPSVYTKRTSPRRMGTNSVGKREELNARDVEETNDSDVKETNEPDEELEPIGGPENPTSRLPSEGTRDLNKIFGRQDRLNVVRRSATTHRSAKHRIRSIMETHGGDYTEWARSNPGDYSIPSNQLRATQRAQLVFDHRGDLNSLQRLVAQDIIRSSVGVEGTQVLTSH